MPRPSRGDHLLLEARPLGAGLGEPPAQDDGCPRPLGRRVPDYPRYRLGRYRHHHKVHLPVDIAYRAVSRPTEDAPSLAAHRYHLAGKAFQVAPEELAEATWLVGGADQGDPAGGEDRVQ